MVIKGNFPFLEEKGHVISLVGAGGKTTLMYSFAKYFADRGVRTIVTTSTHIRRPEEDLWARTPEEVQSLWSRGLYAVVGMPSENGKLESLPAQELESCIRMADVTLIEADGAKRRPCKVPAEQEPVIPALCDIVIGVMGMNTLGEPLHKVCFRENEAVRLLGAKPSDLMTTEMMAEILASEKGTRKNVGNREYYAVLNQCDSEERIRAAEQILGILREKGIDPCVLTAFPPEERR